MIHFYILEVPKRDLWSPKSYISTLFNTQLFLGLVQVKFSALPTDVIKVAEE